MVLPNDLAAIQVPTVSGPSTGLTPIVAFADQASAQKFLMSAGPVTLASATSIIAGTDPDSGITDTTNGNTGSVTSVGSSTFQAEFKTQSGDSGGAGVVQPGGTGTQYIAGIVSNSGGGATPNGPGGPTNFAYLSTASYDKLIDAIPAGTNFGDLAPDLIEGAAAKEMIRGSQRKADIITDGDDDVIAAGSGGGLLNTETGQDGVVFLPGAVGEADPGTTVVVSPGITTLVGGGANDKLVLLADRVGDGSGQPSGPSALSDASDTVQLLGGFDLYGSDVPSFMGYFGQNDPSVGPCYRATYTMEGKDLIIGIDPDDNSWDSEICIKNYEPGDFGLTFSGSNDADRFQDGTESAEDFEDAEQAAMKKLTAQPQASSAVDDDPSVSWQDQLPVSLYGDSLINSVPPPVSDVAIAADLQAVLSDDGGDPSPSDPQDPNAPVAPTIAGATFGQATAAEASASPFGGMAITDGSPGATDTVTIMLLGGGGTLTGAGLTANPDGTYTLAAADAATVTAELQALAFTPDAGAAGTKSTTVLTVTDRSSAGGSTTDTTTTVTDTAAGPPLSSIAIGGTRARQTTADLAVTPFAGVTVTDGNAGTADTLTIALSGGG